MTFSKTPQGEIDKQQQIDPSSIESMLRAKAEDIVPESLRADFEAELKAGSLVLKVREKIDLINRRSRDSEIKLDRITEATLSTWVREMLMTIAYPRYVKLMKQHNKRPTPFNRFKREVDPDGCRQSTFQNFIDLEKSGIKVGSRVRHGQETFFVKGISKNCRLLLRNEDATTSNDPRSAHPGVVEVLDE